MGYWINLENLRWNRLNLEHPAPWRYITGGDDNDLVALMDLAYEMQTESPECICWDQLKVLPEHYPLAKEILIGLTDYFEEIKGVADGLAELLEESIDAQEE